MNITKYAIFAVLMMLSSSLYAGSSTIPANVKAIYPQPDSRVNLAPSAFPMGIQQISILFDKEASVNHECEGEACIYIEGDENPIQTVGISGASTDFTQTELGCVLFPYSCKSNGKYRVTIPEGFWKFEGSNPTFSGALDLHYEILNPQTIFPTETVVKELSEFRLEFPYYDEVTLIDPKKIELFQLSSPDKYPLTVTVGTNEDGTPSNYIDIKLNAPITASGEYSLFVQEGAAEGTYVNTNAFGQETVITEPNIEALYRYTVSLIDAPKIAPEEGIVESFTTFELTVPDGADFWFVNDKAINFIYKANPDGSLAPDASYRLTGNRVDETNIIVLTITENGEPVTDITPQAGKYALKLASGLFSGSWNGEFINSAPFVYYYDAIEDPNSVKSPSIKDKPREIKGIYSIDGKMISEDSESVQQEYLPEGIYIIDGKKTHLRKFQK